MNDRTGYVYEMAAIFLEAEAVKSGLVSNVLRKIGKEEPLDKVGKADLFEVHLWMTSMHDFELVELAESRKPAIKRGEFSYIIIDARRRVAAALGINPSIDDGDTRP